MKKIRRIIKKTVSKLAATVAPEKYKEYHELQYWKGRSEKEDGNLFNQHYEFFYTDLFDLPLESYESKRILDIGCGPRGSLEWADMCAERVGLDPLVPQYLELGAKKHKMTYIASPSEKIPFPDGHFDVVCSFNSLDHVADYHKTVAEIKRVTKPGGSFLVIVEVNHPPSSTEPISLEWNFIEDFLDVYQVYGEVRKYENGDHNVYGQIKKDDRFNEDDSSDRPGFLAARLDRI